MHTQKARIVLFKSTIRPLLEYCSLVFSSMSTLDRRTIENVQRSFTKSIFGCSSALTYRQRCVKTNLEPLWLRRLKLNLTFLFRLTHLSAYSNNPSIHFRPEPPYAIRNSNHTFSVPRTRSSLRTNFFLIKYLKIWNSLPSEIRSSENLSDFKHRLNTHLTIERLSDSYNCPLDLAFESGILGV